MSNEILQSLIGDRIDVAKYIDESQLWLVRFKSGATINIECMWRLLEDGVITSTSYDHKQLFGNEKPLNGEAAITEMSEHKITSLESKEKTGDINIQLGKHFILQIISNSSGYESWQFTNKEGQSIVSVNGEFHGY